MVHNRTFALVKVKQVLALPSFRLFVLYSDDKAGIIDFSRRRKKIDAATKNLFSENFDKVIIENGTLAWKDIYHGGEYDIDPFVSYTWTKFI